MRTSARRTTGSTRTTCKRCSSPSRTTGDTRRPRRSSARSKDNGHELRLPFFRLYLAERDYDAALRIADEVRAASDPHARARATRRRELPGGGTVYLKRGEPERALPEIEVLRQAAQADRNNRKLELNLLETQGLYLCATGAGSAGLKLLAKSVERTKDDYSHHAWGNGAYYMEGWGVGAALVGKLDVAEEAFHEALRTIRAARAANWGCRWCANGRGGQEEVEQHAAGRAAAGRRPDVDSGRQRAGRPSRRAGRGARRPDAAANWAGEMTQPVRRCHALAA
ncbi:MAG: hypothetical protein U0736_16785 [Gemmataceae bacterium]